MDAVVKLMTFEELENWHVKILEKIMLTGQFSPYEMARMYASLIIHTILCSNENAAVKMEIASLAGEVISEGVNEGT